MKMKFPDIIKLICSCLTATSSTIWAIYTGIKNQMQINYWNSQDNKPKEPDKK